MMYVLTEEEMQALKKARNYEINLARGKLQTLCTRIADNMPIRIRNQKEVEPWRCKITVEKLSENGDYRDEWYCDNCPVDEICPHDDKEYSK